MSKHENGKQQPQLDGLVRRAARLLREGRPEQALPLLRRAYAQDDAHFDAALNLGGAYILSGRFREAIPILEALRERHPANAQVWTNLGAAYLGNPVLATNEQQQRAISAFKRALELDPAAHSVAYNIGLIYRDRKERNEAISWFRKALQHDPRDQHARNQLKRLLEEEGLGD